MNPGILIYGDGDDRRLNPSTEEEVCVIVYIFLVRD